MNLTFRYTFLVEDWRVSSPINSGVVCEGSALVAHCSIMNATMATSVGACDAGAVASPSIDNACEKQFFRTLNLAVVMCRVRRLAGAFRVPRAGDVLEARQLGHDRIGYSGAFRDEAENPFGDVSH